MLSQQHRHKNYTNYKPFEKTSLFHIKAQLKQLDVELQNIRRVGAA